MFSIFKRKTAVKKADTFKNRVHLFWEWYAEVAPRFYQTIEAKKCPSLATEVSNQLDESLPGFAWVFGPGADGVGHSFTLTGEGKPHHQLLAAYWLSQAPKLSGWTFYSARQPGEIGGQRIHISDQIFDPLEFWLTPSLNHEEEKVDLAVWHPLFKKMEEGKRWTVLFLFLDEVLGENGTQQRVGQIELHDKLLAEAIPLKELKPFLNKVESENGWKRFPPGELWSSYTFASPSSRFLRADIIAGSTRHIEIVNDFAAAAGDLTDPIAGSDADFVFVAFESDFLPQGKQAEARGEIEEALDKTLIEQASGQLLGGAYGNANAYIDLLLFDGEVSIEIVLEVLRERGLPIGTSINYFAKEKRGYRIVL